MPKELWGAKLSDWTKYTLQNLNLVELRELARDLGLTGLGRLNRDNLIDELARKATYARRKEKQAQQESTPKQKPKAKSKKKKKAKDWSLDEDRPLLEPFSSSELFEEPSDGEPSSEHISRAKKKKKKKKASLRHLSSPPRREVPEYSSDMVSILAKLGRGEPAPHYFEPNQHPSHQSTTYPSSVPASQLSANPAPYQPSHYLAPQPSPFPASYPPSPYPAQPTFLPQLQPTAPQPSPFPTPQGSRTYMAPNPSPNPSPNLYPIQPAASLPRPELSPHPAPNHQTNQQQSAVPNPQPSPSVSLPKSASLLPPTGSGKADLKRNNSEPGSAGKREKVSVPAAGPMETKIIRPEEIRSRGKELGKGAQGVVYTAAVSSRTDCVVSRRKGGGQGGL